ncbi:Lrp/AsnC ligand binding domain-containing protein [Hyphomonas sp. FCG-A18]|jgi:Lrp/AsnC family leucine-responsive transcriptional regulator|uniref:Lrp/AsnC family transcriptional regulator n=1 Tax=Hyphomonas sp. FCG-A18 TaxID=3080019 RepID=UPI002B2CAD26|nr:Lrp/AsnC ligand binding domain-containing protein [Hyphomonas sp. FCG-A18]
MSGQLGILDEADRRILREVQSDGRVPVVELAQRIGLSKTPCLKRLRRLEKDGVIRGYRADIDPDKIRQGYLVYVQVKLSSTTREVLDAFNKAVRGVPEIMSCHMMAGGFDYLLKIRTSDMKAYRQFMGDVLSQLPNIAQTSTFPVMEQVKESHELII